MVCADLRGYGDSSCPPSDDVHLPYSKRELARDMVSVMDRLGHPRFAVVGHDQSGRVAYRMAHVLPIDASWARADDRLTVAYWPWSLLAQPPPLPERLIGASPEAVLQNALDGGWGSAPAAFDDRTRAAYLTPLRDPDHVHAICEEYRAAATVDREHDQLDRAADRRITQPLLALWSGNGPLGTWYAADGGPLAIWRELVDDVRGHPVDGGHFFPEEHPAETAQLLGRFLADVR